jgi:hypothetical protein
MLGLVDGGLMWIFAKGLVVLWVWSHCEKWILARAEIRRREEKRRGERTREDDMRRSIRKQGGYAGISWPSQCVMRLLLLHLGVRLGDRRTRSAEDCYLRFTHTHAQRTIMRLTCSYLCMRRERVTLVVNYVWDGHKSGVVIGAMW